MKINVNRKKFKELNDIINVLDKYFLCSFVEENKTIYLNIEKKYIVEQGDMTILGIPKIN